LSEENAKPRLAAVLGWPVGHSLSPLIHKTWAAREGLNAHYVPIAVPASDEAFARAVEALRDLGFAGCNVTLPHKARALKVADRVSEDASAAGAANMLSFTGAGVVADNSDIEGLAESVKSVRQRNKAVLLGGGGAARGAAIALKRRLGFADVLIANRTRARAEEIAAACDARAIAWTAREESLAGADLLVNATSLGMKGAPPLDLDLRALPASACVCDIVYAPLETPLLAAARARGLVAIDGLEMLMRQAAKGYRAWLGRRADVDDDLRRTLENALTLRGA
jgi:shikimate dehydrogenase